MTERDFLTDKLTDRQIGTCNIFSYEYTYVLPKFCYSSHKITQRCTDIANFKDLKTRN